MNTFIDALNELFRIHSKVIRENEYLLEEVKESVENDEDYEYEEDEDYEINCLVGEHKGYSIRDSLDDDEKIILSAIEEEIISKSDTDYEEYYKMVSLLAIEYYNLISISRADYKDCYKSTKKELELMDIIEKSDLSELIGAITDLHTDNLLEIIITILGEYEPELDTEEDEYDYLQLSDIINDKKVQNVIKKFHPNLEEEIKRFDKYEYHLKICDKVEEIDINSLFGFIYLHTLVKQLIDNRLHYLDIMISKLNQISLDDERLYKRIELYLVRFYYVALKSKEKITDLEKNDIEVIEQEEDKSIRYSPILPTLITNFYDYDIMTSNTKIENLSDDIKKKTKKFIKY